MNKIECKKYLKRTIKKLLINNQDLTIQNLKTKIQEEIEKDSSFYIAYSLIALHTLQNSGALITAEELEREIDIVTKLYDKQEAIIKAKNLPQIFSHIEKP